MKYYFLALALVVLAAGCSGSSHGPSADATAFGPPASQALDRSMSMAKTEPVTHNVRTAAKPAAEAMPRKIIYTGSLDLIVGDLSGAVSKLDDLVKQFHGLIAESQMNTNPGSPRSSNWRVRVPVDQFTDFVNQVGKLGEATNNKTESDDVTDKYYDFQVRIDNKKVQVERLQKIIKEETGKVSELLEAERELARVTTELEELKGTVKLLDNQSALSTVNITMHENVRYIPPQAPTFAGSISNTFNASVGALTEFGKTVVLLTVAIAPWLPVIAVVVIPGWLITRRARKRPV